MAGGFRVSTEELAEVVAAMAQLDRDAESLCTDVDAVVTELHGSWSGEAATAQRAAHDRWSAGAAEMRSALADLHRVGDTAHRNYTAAVSANQAMWS